MILNCKLWCRQNPIHPLSETEILKFAAGVELNTVHPIGKAIVEAAEFSNCQNVKVPSSFFLCVIVYSLCNQELLIIFNYKQPS